ncbi:MAG: histidinol dehydrogenase [Planctomycetota bacterium]
MNEVLRVITPRELPRTRREPVDAATLAAVAPIVEDVRREGLLAIERHAVRFGELAHSQTVLLDPAALKASASSIAAEDLDLLRRTAASVALFAGAQRAALTHQLSVPVTGGTAGHSVAPVAAAGCYAPGGRYPLPSSVLMTACVARAAGVARVVVASPKPSPVTLAAAHVAGADAFLCVGGAHAIAALAYGFEGFEPVDLVCGPGNKYVTAAKKLVMGTVGIDMLAGPSELVVLADDSADARIVAADLLAQAEHDDDATPILVTTSRALAHAVNVELARQLTSLTTAVTARKACENGVIVVAASMDEAIGVVDRLAPEHLEVMTTDARSVSARCTNYGGIFIGKGSAEVFGDYGVGPNHTLPTGGSARFAAGLSVFTFLRARTFLDLEPTSALIADTACLARLEGLEAHARAAESRKA